MNTRYMNYGIMYVGASVIALYFTLIPLAACGQALSQQGTNGLSLHLEMRAPTENVLGKGMQVHIALVNNSDKERDTITLRTARIHFVLNQKTTNSQDIKREATMDGSTRVIEKELPGGQILRETIAVKQGKSTLNKGDRSELDVDLTSVFDTLLLPGDYILSATYQDDLKANCEFKVVVDDRGTVPALIELIEHGRFERKIWARNTLAILTGQPDWSPTAGESHEKTRGEVAKLRRWWGQHQSNIRLRSEAFDPKIK